MNKKLLTAMSVGVFLWATTPSEAKDSSLKLWYDRPAEQWTEALPLGNGSLGAMVYGGTELEKIQFNEETLWQGEPHDYAHPGACRYLDTLRQMLFDGRQKEAEELAMREFMSEPVRQKAYQPFGDLLLHFPGHNKFTGYTRTLDLQNALHRVIYQSGAVSYGRECFASHPGGVLVLRLTASRGKALTFSIGFDAPHEDKRVEALGNRLRMEVRVKEGVLRGTALAEVVTDGETTTHDNRIYVSGAGSAVVFLTAATNYVNYRDVSGDPTALAWDALEAALAKGYKGLLREHLRDYRSLFDRFAVGFGENEKSGLTTDRRIVAFSKEAGDPQLPALYVQYGRYLMIASSRRGTRPANLQGIWNDQIKPPWDSKWTVNINTEMNYWPANLTGLAECHEPLFDLVAECAETGKSTAREHYSCPGWVLHHNTDAWRATAPINHSNHGIWVTGGAWLSLHLWDHYRFTQDRDFLARRAYPVMRGAAEFFTRFLIRDPRTGYLISTPSNSPEQGGLVAGPAMDHQIVRSLFRACTEASELLGTDAEFAATLRKMLPEIAPDRIGRHGQLQEWQEDVDDPGNKHRHVSHLWAVYPGHEINWKETPDLMKAARQSLLFRGDEGTGWSLAWKINLWARFREGNHAWELIKMVFRPVRIQNEIYTGGGGSYANLFDAHPPFQIDGNFGAAAGIIEMLVQSDPHEITLLPALPDALPEGHIRGVHARGGFVLDFEWKAGKLQKLKVHSIAGNKCRIVCAGQTAEWETVKNKNYAFNGMLQRM